jgi:hypothetical protein
MGIFGLKIYHLATLLFTGTAGISLHMQWPLTSQSRGSLSQREQLVFHYGSNSTPKKMKIVFILQN